TKDGQQKHLHSNGDRDTQSGQRFGSDSAERTKIENYSILANRGLGQPREVRAEERADHSGVEGGVGPVVHLPAKDLATVVFVRQKISPGKAQRRKVKRKVNL